MNGILTVVQIAGKVLERIYPIG